MEIKEITDKVVWNQMLINFEEYTFLQSWQWGEINSKLGKETIVRLFVIDGGEVVGMVQAFTITARRGKILFVPHGPLTKNINAWKKVLGELKIRAGRYGCDCLRISPLEINNHDNWTKYSKEHFIESGVIMHAEDTWIVDLKGSEEDVLMRMRKTTRNLIRRGIKENIEIRQSESVADVGSLYDLQMEVVKRNNFVPFTKDYIRREMVVFTEDKMAKLFIGKSVEGVMGAALIVFLGKYAYYYQSGSKESKLPVNYLLQWEVIKEAKKRGCEKYNMWGIAPDDSPNHPWRGLTIFKTGFGGEVVRYMKSVDFPINKIGYLKLRILEKIPKTWRSKLTNR